MTALPVCVIGGGAIGRRHAEVAALCEAVELIAVVEPDATRRDALAAEGLPTVAEIADVPRGTQAAVVAAPTSLHAVLARQALDRGWALLVEKPLCATLAEADALIAAAAGASLPLVTGHHRRCHPFVAAAVERLPRLGRLVGIQALWALRKHDSYHDEGPWRREPGGGPVLQNLVHEVDLMRLLAGDIVEVSALASSAIRGFAVEDTAAVALRFAGGALGSALISDAAASPWAFEAASGESAEIAHSGADYMRLVGTDGAMGFPSLDLWINASGGETEWRKPLSREEGPVVPRLDPLAEQMRRFAGVAAGGEDAILATGANGRAALATSLAVLRAAETGRAIELEKET